MLRIGYHISISGGIDRVFERADAIGCTSMQMFLTNPRGWQARMLEKSEIESFREKERKYDIRPLFAHMPYLPNPASPKEHVYAKTVESLLDTVTRCDALGVSYIVAHLGSHLGEGKEKGFERVVGAIGKAARAAKNTVILMENEAGQRNSVGSQLEDLVELHRRIGMDNVGFCLDTCHAFAAGYDITKREVAEEVLHTLDMTRIHAIHLNDALHPLGSGLDRHANIGFGHIGRKGFETFLGHPGIKEKPLILETPGGHAGEGELRLVRKIISDAS